MSQEALACRYLPRERRNHPWGSYMMFIVKGGVPSMATYIELGPAGAVQKDE
jgi:hypothetical protein